MTTTYRAVVQRSGNWWAIEVPDVSGAFTQARRLDQVEHIARDVIAMMLDVDPESFKLDVDLRVPGEWRSEVNELKRAHEEAQRAQEDAALKARALARR